MTVTSFVTKKKKALDFRSLLLIKKDISGPFCLQFRSKSKFVCLWIYSTYLRNTLDVSIHPSIGRSLALYSMYKSNNISFPPFLSFAVCLSGSVKSNTTASKERQESCSLFDQQFPVFLDQERKKVTSWCFYRWIVTIDCIGTEWSIAFAQARISWLIMDTIGVKNKITKSSAVESITSMTLMNNKICRLCRHRAHCTVHCTADFFQLCL